MRNGEGGTRRVRGGGNGDVAEGGSAGEGASAVLPPAPPSRSRALAQKGLRTAGDLTGYMLASLEDESLGSITVRQLDKRAKGVIAVCFIANAAGAESVLRRPGSRQALPAPEPSANGDGHA